MREFRAGEGVGLGRRGVGMGEGSRYKGRHRVMQELMGGTIIIFREFQLRDGCWAKFGSGKLVNVNPHASRLTFCIVIARMVNQAGL